MKITFHRRSEPRGLDATISARYDWSVVRQFISFPLRHWNLRNLTLQQESYLTTCRFQNVRLYLLVFPPRGTGKDYICIRNIMGCPMSSLGKETLVVKVVIKFSSLYIVQSFSCHVSFEPSNSVSILSLSLSFFFALFTLVFPFLV